MSRLPSLRPADLHPAQTEVYDAIVGRRAAGKQMFRLTNDDGSLTGPFNALLHAPRLGGALQQVGEAIRFGSVLPAAARELAILLVAKRWDSDFEWYAHESIALDVGVAQVVIDAIRAGDAHPLADDPILAAVQKVCDAVLEERPLDDQMYAEVVNHLGEAPLVELTILVGYYTALAFVLRTFDVGAPEGDPPFSSPTGAAAG